MTARPAAFARALAVAASIAHLGACDRNDGPPSAVGTIEYVEVDVAPMVPARVTRVWVDEGATVRAGDTLVSLTQATLAPDIEGRRARVSAAQAQLRDLEAGARPAQIERAQAELRLAESEALRTANDLARYKPLLDSGSISEQQYEAASTAAAGAAARRDAAAESLRLLREGARPDQVQGARAEVESARAALDASLRTASDLTLTARAGGTVTGRHVEPGEILGAGEPAMTIGQTDAPWARVYVGPALLPRIAVGDTVTGVLDDFPDRPVTGRIVALNDRAEFTPRVALTEEERADLLFGVKIEWDDPGGRLRAGLPITVRFRPRDPP